MCSSGGALRKMILFESEDEEETGIRQQKRSNRGPAVTPIHCEIDRLYDLEKDVEEMESLQSFVQSSEENPEMASSKRVDELRLGRTRERLADRGTPVRPCFGRRLFGVDGSKLTSPEIPESIKRGSTPPRRNSSCVKDGSTPVNSRPLRNDNPYTPESQKIKTKTPLPLPYILRTDRLNDDYEHEHSLGCGKFGEVLLVRSRSDNQLYAVKKTSKRTHLKYKGERSESQIHAVVHHQENIVRYYNSWQDDEHYYLVIEYCAGGCIANHLEALIKRNERYSEKQMVHMAKHLLAGLKYLHGQGFAHMDIKPGNIFRKFGPEYPDTSEEFPLYKIGDFGHTKRESDAPVDGDNSYADKNYDITHSQPFMYDIYTAGVTLFECANQRLENPVLSHPEYLSDDFHNFLKLLAHQDYTKRPSARAALKQLKLLEEPDSSAELIARLRAEISRLQQDQPSDSNGS